MTFDRILFGKKYKYLNKDKKIKRLRKFYITLFFCYGAVLLSFGIVAYINLDLMGQLNVIYSYFNEKLALQTPLNETDIYFENITEEEQVEILEMLADVKPIYLKFQKSITFTRDVDPHYKGNKTGILGLNRGRGEIFILYPQDTTPLRESICHELSHSFYFSDETTHAIIYDLHKFQTCFKSSDKYIRSKIEEQLK